MTRALALATIATIALVVGSLLVRILNPFGAPPPSVSDVVPHLWGVGACLVLALTRTWAPALGWTAAVVGSTASALGAVGLVREVRAATGEASEPVMDALLVVALLVPPTIAAAYGTAPRRTPRAILVGAWGSVGAIGVVLVAALVRRTLGLDGGGLPEWAWLGSTALLLALGLARDLRPALARTRQRLAEGNGARPPGAGRTRLSALRVLVDELVPGREAGRAEAVESERGRLAADLHAEVLPSLRRALAAAEAGGSVERLAADLRSAVDEVESLLMARRSIVLEEMGLLAAVEWLAERIEERSSVRVAIEVEGATSFEERPQREAERAAYRVAQLALDNVVRHAAGASAVVRVAVRPAAIGLEVEDDAEGPPVDEAAAARAGRRGIADMRAEARACGASLEVGRGADGRGTLVRFRWPA